MKPTQLAGPTPGRIVVFGFDSMGGSVEERPAIVTRVFAQPDLAQATDEAKAAVAAGQVQLQVFTDGPNDDSLVNEDERAGRAPGKTTRSVVWRTSVAAADDQSVAQVGRWRWPPGAPIQ